MKKDIEDFLRKIEDLYSREDIIDLEEDKTFYDKKSKEFVFKGQRITDFYQLDIDKERPNEGRRIIKTGIYDRFIHLILPASAKKRHIERLNRRYMKDDLLEFLVSTKKIDGIEKRTRQIYYCINNLEAKVSKAISRIGKDEENSDRDRYDRGDRRDDKRDEYGQKRASTTRIIIGSNENSREKIFSYMHNTIRSEYLEMIESMGIIGVTVEIKDLDSIIREITSRYDPPFIEREMPVYLPRKVNWKPLDEYLWNLQNIGLKDAHEITKGKGATIAVIDTGADYRHPEIKDRFIKGEIGYNFILNKDDPMDDNSHGTHVSGTIAGEKIGIARESTIYALKVLDSSGSGSNYDVMRAIDWSIRKGVDVISMSLGSSSYSKAFQEICTHAREKGILVVAAAGNDGRTVDNYPASYKDVISVAAVDMNNLRAPFSNMNNNLDISAPGVSIYSCIPGGSYKLMNGTSMATPHVSGCLALACSLKKDKDAIEKAVIMTAKKLGEKDKYGAGLIMADRLVKQISQGYRWF